MIASEARISTPSGSRYLVQLCKHWGHKFAVDYTPAKGKVTFAADRAASFEAGPESLLMRVEVADEGMLARMQDVVVEHLKRFAFRENLGDVQWSSAG
ncbi:MAG: DUF2218 domain-containing protein [Alphaproteobacteria bacterium]